MKIVVTCSGGGHYIEAMNACCDLFKEKHDFYFITYKQIRKNNDLFRETYFVIHPKHCFFVKRFFLFLINFVQSFYYFLKVRPQIVISTGADVTLSTMLIAKMFRKKVIFIESGAQVTKGSLTGRIIYPFADLFIIQWDELKSVYPKAHYGGPLL